MFDTLLESLQNYAADSKADCIFDIEPVEQEKNTAKITLFDREELPIYLTLTHQHVLTMIHLFNEEECQEDKRDALHEEMLRLNLPMPLSSLAKMNDWYVIYGSLSATSDIETIVQEFAVLSDNALETLDELKDFIKA